MKRFLCAGEGYVHNSLQLCRDYFVRISIFWILILSNSVSYSTSLHHVNDISLDGHKNPRQIQLQVGDSIPDYIWDIPFQIINDEYGIKTLKLSEFKDKKLLILDFWATWCTTCIKAFPEVYNLNQQFSNDLLIIPVNSEKRDLENIQYLKDFLDKRNTSYRLVSILDREKDLYNLSRHKTIPHYLWIMNGKLVNISGSEEVLTADFSKLNDANFNNELNPLVRVKLLLTQNDNPNNQLGDLLIWESSIKVDVPESKYKFEIKKNDKGNQYGIEARNVPLLTLYKFAFPEIKHFLNSHFYFQDNSLKTIIPHFNLDNRVDYDFSSYEVDDEMFQYFIQSDLKRTFGWYPIVINKDVPCLILRIGTGPLFKEIPYTKRITNIYEDIKGPKFYENGPLSSLVRQLNQILEIPVIDETDYRKPVFIKLPEDLRNVDELISIFNQQGFDASIETKNIRIVEFKRI